MLLKAITPRSSKVLSQAPRLYANSALFVTVELPCEVYAGKRYHLTLSKTDLTELLKVIEDREEEIKKIHQEHLTRN